MYAHYVHNVIYTTVYTMWYDSPWNALFYLVLSPHHLLVVVCHSRLPHAAYFPSIFHYLPLFSSDWNLAKNPICRSARSLKKSSSLSYSTGEWVTSRAVGYIKLLRHATCSTWQLGHNSCLCLHPSSLRIFLYCHYNIQTQISKEGFTNRAATVKSWGKNNFV